MQKSFYFDFNIENLGHNRRDNESVLHYIKRVWADEYHSSSKDFAVSEFCPVNMKDLNAKMSDSINDSTFYFCYAAGIRKRNKMKQREMMNEPAKLSSLGVGFNLDLDQTMSFCETPNKLIKKPKESISLTERLLTATKYLVNPVSINNKVFFENCLHVRCPADYLDNIKNDKMNNVTSLDYANKDLCHDSDLILPRWSTEYPRIASNYQTKDSNNKPWGNKSKPVFFDIALDSRIATPFETGVWYYTSMQLCDHHELGGFPNRFWWVMVVLGLEFRPQLYINIFNRLRRLEFQECSMLNKEMV